jgi:RNA polymerase sigma-70 factor, ECF subfamily
MTRERRISATDGGFRDFPSSCAHSAEKAQTQTGGMTVCSALSPFTIKSVRHAYKSSPDLTWWTCRNPQATRLLPDRSRGREADGLAEFGRMLEAEIPRLRRYARALCRDAAAADDLVQDCLCRALRKSHLFQPNTDLRAWLFTMLHNLHVNGVRRSVRQRSSVPFEDVEPLLTESPAQGAGLTLRDLDRAMGEISEEQRQVLLLVGLEAMSYEEVATILDVPIGIVRSRLSRGRERLRELIGHDQPKVPGVRHAAPASAENSL